MTLRILVDENIPLAQTCLGSLGVVERVPGRALDASQLRGVDALLVRSVTRVDAALLRHSPVRFVGSATSGVDHVDRNYLRRQGIAFAHAPGANANAVVEYVLAAVAAADDTLERLLAGGRVGIIGYGAIGRALAARLGSLGVAHCVYDPWLARSGVCHPGSLSQVLDCDVVSVHAQLTRQPPWPSFHLLGEAELGAMGAAPLLINASRGAVVDNRALLRALESGRGPRTVLDVWEAEPGIDPALLGRVLLGTAHIAGYSLDGKLRATRMLAAALAAHLGVPAAATATGAGDCGAAHSDLSLPPLRLAAGVTGAALLRYLLRARYDIVEDDRLLREATLGMEPAVAAAGFDRLRRDYRVRRELAGSVVHGTGVAPQARRLVAALGCELAGVSPAAQAARSRAPSAGKSIARATRKPGCGTPP
ncbi:MAG: 4-phosphoerythronate dehydrogenase [Halioglobus sp.]|nr:4-phosphoerythronate dehydrogenase [Halioglobus sp.]